jgi:hypothetical protein
MYCAISRIEQNGFLTERTNDLFLSYTYLQRGRVKDPVAYLRATEQRARERTVAYETVRILRQKVITCYRTEGVNHYENCHDVAKDYYEIITKKDLGQLQPEWANPAKKDGW